MRSQHVAFTERNAVLNKIHEALAVVTFHSDETEILEEIVEKSEESFHGASSGSETAAIMAVPHRSRMSMSFVGNGGHSRHQCSVMTGFDRATLSVQLFESLARSVRATWPLPETTDGAADDFPLLRSLTLSIIQQTSQCDKSWDVPAQQRRGYLTAL